MAFCRKSWRWARHIPLLTLLTLTQMMLTTLTVLPKMDIELCWMPMTTRMQTMHHKVSFGNLETPD